MNASNVPSTTYLSSSIAVRTHPLPVRFQVTAYSQYSTGSFTLVLSVDGLEAVWTEFAVGRENGSPTYYVITTTSLTNDAEG